MASVKKTAVFLRRYQKYIYLLLLSLVFVYILTGSLKMVKGKVIDYFNDNQSLLARQASIGLKDLFLHYFGELHFLARLDEVVLMDGRGREMIQRFMEMSGGEVMGITRMDEKGIIVYTVPDEKAIGRDIGHQKHVVYLLQEKRPVLSDVFLAVQNFKTVACHVPVFDREGGFRGSLALLVNFERVAQKFIDKIDTGEGSNAWIMNQSGTVLYAKNSEMLSEKGEKGKVSGSFLTLKKAMMSGRSGALSYCCQPTGRDAWKNARIWAAFNPVNIERTFWSIAVSTPEPVILSTMAMIEKRWGFLLLIVGVCGLILVHSVIRTRTLHQERKKREKVIRELEWQRSFTEKALDSQLDTFFVFDLKNRKAVRWNRSFHDLCGYSDREIGAMKLPFSNCSREDEEKALLAVAKALDEGAARAELELISKSGCQVPMEFHMSTLNSEDGEPEYLIAVGRDVTERKKAQAAILQNQRLGVIGEMAAAIAHDFNNSLQIILGNLELISRGNGLSEPIRRRLETIRRVSDDAAARVQMIQRMGGKREGRYGYTRIDIASLLRDVVVSTRPLWKDSMEKDGQVIRLVTDFQEGLEVNGSPGELRAAFHNVIKNSVEAMPEGGEILITSECQGDFVRVTVKDNGRGMDEETRQRVFQPFFSTKGFELGRGLGLSGAYTILNEHGGQISIEDSRPGGGTVVEIRIPGCGDACEKRENNDVPGSGPKGLGILWVDDEAMIREVAQEMVALLDCRADFARDGVQAMDLLRRNQYDLVITDVGMPGMNGLELAWKVRELNGRRVKIAMVTGWGDDMGEIDTQKPLFDFFLQKPVTIEQIQTLVRDAGTSFEKGSDGVSEYN